MVERSPSVSTHELFTDVKTLFLNNKEVKSIVIDETDGGIIYEKTTTPIVLSAGSNEIDYGQNVILNGSIPFDTNSIKIYQNDILIGTTFSSNGVFSYTVSGLNAGTYTFKAVFEGDESYVEGESNGIIVTVNKVTPVLTLTSNKNTIRPGETYILSGTTTIDGEIEIYRDSFSSPYIRVNSSNGVFSYTTSGTYNSTDSSFTRSYYAKLNEGVNNNQGCSNTISMIVLPRYSTNLTIEVPTLIYSDTFNITGILTDENNNPIPNASIKLYRDTSILEATATTNNNGEVTFHRDAPTSITTYNFQLKYDENQYFSGSNSSIVTRVVNKETSVLNLTSPLNGATYIDEGNKVPFSGNLSDNDATALGSKTIQIKRQNNVINTTTTDSNGDFVGVIPFEFLDEGENELTFVFIEEEYYTGATQTVTITVENPILTPSNLTLTSSKPILSSADAFKNWTQPFNMGIDEENGLPYLTATGSGVILNGITFPSEFEINYKFKTTVSSSSNSSLLFNIGTDINNGILIGTENQSSSTAMRICTRTNNSNSQVAIQSNSYTYQEWTNATIHYENNIISITMNDKTISYTLTNPNIIGNYLGVYGSGYSSNVRLAEFEIIDLSDNSIVYSSHENITAQLNALVTDENDNPCPDETVTFHLGLHEIQRTTDSNGIALLEYTSKQMGNVPITATLNNLSDSITLEDCNYYNDGSSITNLRKQSNVNLSTDGEWIIISKSNSGEEFVFPPAPLCCFTGTDNWEMSIKCKTSDYSSQALAVELVNCNYGGYVGDSQYWGCYPQPYGYLSGSYNVLDTDKITYKREDGYWKAYVNDNTLITSRAYSWSNNRSCALYTNNGRRQSVKEWKVKRNIEINKLQLNSEKTRINIDNLESTILSATLTSLNQPVANKTITFKENGVAIGTATTNNHGIATFSYEPSDYGDYVVSAEYNNLNSDSISINANDGSNILYYNSGADLSKVADFNINGAWHSGNNTVGTYTVTSDGEEWLTLTRSGGGNYGHIPLTPLTGINQSFKLSCIIENKNSDGYVASYSGFYANNLSNGYGFLCQWHPFRMCRSDKGSYDSWNVWNNQGGKSDATYKYEVIFNTNGNITHNLYDLNDNLLNTYNTGTSLNLSSGNVEFGIHMDNNRVFRIKEIIAEILE